jgi:hypothetical protein
MTALSADKSVPRIGAEAVPDDMKLGVAASVTIYRGALVMRDLTGYARPARSSGDFDFACRILGVAREKVIGTTAGAKKVSIERGVFGFANSSSTAAVTDVHVGEPCFAVDDQTVAATDGNGAYPYAGRVIRIEDSIVFVEVGTTNEPGVEDVRCVAGADYSSTGQGLFVELLTANGVTTCNAAGETVFGVLLNAPASGAVAIVRRRGRCKVMAGGSITAPALVATTNAGKSKTAVASATKTDDAGAALDALLGSYVAGWSRSDGSSDVLHAIVLEPMGAVPTTAS